jgi:hypothetical protein
VFCFLGARFSAAAGGRVLTIRGGGGVGVGRNNATNNRKKKKQKKKKHDYKKLCGSFCSFGSLCWLLRFRLENETDGQVRSEEGRKKREGRRGEIGKNWSEIEERVEAADGLRWL